MKRKKLSRFLSLLTAFCMVLALLPGTVLAADGDSSSNDDYYYFPVTMYNYSTYEDYTVGSSGNYTLTENSYNTDLEEILAENATEQLTNVAKNGTASYGGTNVTQENVASNAIDGSMSTYAAWNSGSNYTARASNYLQVDLGDTYEVDSINLYRYYSDSRTYNATVIAVSEDGENYTAVYNSDTNNVHGFGAGTDSTYSETSSGMSVDLSSEPISARYVRVYMYGSSANTSNHILELEVYAYSSAIDYQDGIFFVKSGDKYYTDSASNASSYGINSSGYQDIAKEELAADGSIEFNYAEAGLFTDEEDNKEVYTDIQFPFVQEGGYYVFDSSSMDAYFSDDPEDGATLTHSAARSAGRNASGGSATGFHPFDATVSTDSYPTWHFGMNMEVEFYANESGTVINGSTTENMEFEFSGDDDVWVYVDGKLILDFGGIHEALSGKIDFATGYYYYEAKNTSNSKIYIVGSIYDSSVDANTVATAFGISGTTQLGTCGQFTKNDFLSEDVQHTLSFYYLERGTNESNCKIKFNLIQKNTLTVEKSMDVITDNTDAEVNEYILNQLQNADFTFQIVDESGSACSGLAYTIYEDGVSTGETGTTDSDGKLTLKLGQQAVFKDLAAGYYYVQEVGNSLSLTTTGAESLTVDYTSTYTSSGGALVSDDGVSYVYIPAQTNYNYTYQYKISCANTFTYGSPADDVYVVDYGIPVTVDPLSNDETTTAEISGYTILSGEDYVESVEINKVEDGNDTLTVYFKDVINDTIQIYYTYADDLFAGTGIQHGATVTIIPATNVTYEENHLATVEGSDWTAVDASDDTSTVTQDESGNYVDADDRSLIVQSDENILYGYDEAYETYDDGTFSMNSYLYADGLSKDNAKTDAASFTFTGDGFDIIAECGVDTGVLYVRVTDSDGNKQVFIVDTYFTGDTEDEIASGNMTYQIPVLHAADGSYITSAGAAVSLPYGTYTVEIYGRYLASSGAVVAAASAEETVAAVSEDATEEEVVEAMTDAATEEVESLLEENGDDELEVTGEEVTIVTMDEASPLNLVDTGEEQTEETVEATAAAVAELVTETTVAETASEDTGIKVYVDGFRVYNPLGTVEEGSVAYTAYEEAGELNPDYTSVYATLNSSWDPVNALNSDYDSTIIYVENDGSGKWEYATYKTQGPENEIYLAGDSAIAFKVESGTNVMISAKSVTESSANGFTVLDSTGKETGSFDVSTTEMYYDITDYVGSDGIVVIKGTSGIEDFVSIVNVKTSSGSIEETTAVTTYAAVLSALSGENEVESDYFTPEMFEVSTSASIVKLNKSVTVSVKADFSVSYITVNGNKVTPNNLSAVSKGKASYYSFSYSLKATELGTLDIEVIAYDESGNASEPQTATVTVTKTGK